RMASVAFMGLPFRKGSTAELLPVYCRGLAPRVRGRVANRPAPWYTYQPGPQGQTTDQTGGTPVAEPLRCVPADSVLTGWDFSTGAVKCLAFDLDGHTLAEVRLPTDLWTAGGVSELNLMQLEGQARASTRAMAARLRELGRLHQWAAGGISATHHTAGRIDRDRAQVRRAICWNDHTLAEYHARGLERLGGQGRAFELIGGPWAIRYTLSHLVKDEERLREPDWRR